MWSLFPIFGWLQVALHCSSALQYYGYSLEREADLGKEYSQVIDHSVQYVWRYSYDRRNRSQVLGDTFRVSTNVDQHAKTHTPILFEVRYLHQSLEWGLPLRSASGRIYNNVNRTLCSDPYASHVAEYDTDEATVQVVVSTRSRSQLTFSIRIAWENNTIRSFGESIQASFSPSSPAQYRLAVPPQQGLPSSAKYSLLYITSDDDVCSTVTVQESSCSSGFNQPENFGIMPVQQIRSQNTMTRKSAVNLKREDLFRGNLLLTFTVNEDSSLCGTPNNKFFSSKNWSSTRYPAPSDALISKTVQFILHEKIGEDGYLFATSATFAFLFLFCTGFAYLFWTRFRMVYVVFYESQQKVLQQCQLGQIQSQDTPCSQQPTSLTITPHTVPGDAPAKEDLQDEDLCCMFFLVPNDHPQQRKRKRYLQDNCRKCARDIAKSTRRYVSTLSVVAAFYILPVLQFVLLYQQVLNDTGDEDLCYYNFMCLHPLGSLTTFNHMFSNVGYVMLGILFIWIVRVEQNRKWHEDVIEDSKPEQAAEMGLHSHFGIFYAMGIALSMEGLMSAFYHICPNRLNYQFDMCFMYVTTMLCLVKLYQGRHPDSNASALMSYGSLALVVLLVAAGVLFQTWYFWFIITVIHFGVVFVMSLHLYSLGEWRIGWPALTKSENASYVISSICHPFRKGIGWMTLFLVLLNVSNWFAAGVGYFLFFQIHDIATHLVWVLLINLLLYSLIYLFLKMKYKEKLMWPTWMYMWLSIPFWFIGLYLFIFRRVDGWHLSQAESRSLNEECILWDFYDWHDIWHFLSAFGIFFMFMFFFTLDDDLRKVRRTSIKVF